MAQINFIDIGAFDGCSARAASQKWEGCKIFSFEPLPENLKNLNPLENQTILPVAAWTFDGKIKFYKGLNESGTVIFGKKTGNIDYTKNISVPCINFSAWVKENLKYDDYNILKLNCEGAEYELIKSLKKHQLLMWFREYYIQWHAHKIKGFNMNEHSEIQKLIKWKSWEVMKCF